MHGPPQSIFALCHPVPCESDKEGGSRTEESEEDHLPKGTSFVECVQQHGGEVNADKGINGVHHNGDPHYRPLSAAGQKKLYGLSVADHVVFQAGYYILVIFHNAASFSCPV